MSGLLVHSPAQVMRNVLITLDLATDPDDEDVDPNDPDAWPAYAAGTEPDIPDNVITVFDTLGRLFPRDMISRQRLEYYGIQIRVRGIDQPTAYTKANAIAQSLDTNLYELTIPINLDTYCVQTFLRTTHPLFLGDERIVSKRQTYVVNGLVNLCLV